MQGPPSKFRLEDFILQEKIAKGSYGAVFRIIRKADRRVFALKQVSLKGLKRVEREQSIDEVRVLKELKHPNIIKYYDSYIDDDEVLNIFMQYASKGTVADVIKSYPPGKMPEPLIWKCFIQALIGLNHIHSKKIIHRDIKALNLFLDAKQNVKVGDMGIARVMSADTLFAHTKMGTPYYLSPELCDDKGYNEKSDIWALGVVLYECCTKRFPFEAQNEGALMKKIVRGQFNPVTAAYSPGLLLILNMCMTYDYKKRPDSFVLLQNPTIKSRAKELNINLYPDPMMSTVEEDIIYDPPHMPDQQYQQQQQGPPQQYPQQGQQQQQYQGGQRGSPGPRLDGGQYPGQGQYPPPGQYRPQSAQYPPQQRGPAAAQGAPWELPPDRPQHPPQQLPQNLQWQQQQQQQHSGRPLPADHPFALPVSPGMLPGNYPQQHQGPGYQGPPSPSPYQQQQQPQYSGYPQQQQQQQRQYQVQAPYGHAEEYQDGYNGYDERPQNRQGQRPKSAAAAPYAHVMADTDPMWVKQLAADVGKMQLDVSEVARLNADRDRVQREAQHAAQRDNLKGLMQDPDWEDTPPPMRLKPEELPAAGGRVGVQWAPAPAGGRGSPIAQIGMSDRALQIAQFKTAAQEQQSAALRATYEPPQYGRKRCTDLQITGPNLRAGGGGNSRPSSAYANPPAESDSTSYVTSYYSGTAYK